MCQSFHFNTPTLVMFRIHRMQGAEKKYTADVCFAVSSKDSQAVPMPQRLLVSKEQRYRVLKHKTYRKAYTVVIGAFFVL